MRADRANAYTRRFGRKADKCVMVRREREGGRERGEREGRAQMAIKAVHGVHDGQVGQPARADGSRQGIHT